MILKSRKTDKVITVNRLRLAKTYNDQVKFNFYSERSRMRVSAEANLIRVSGSSKKLPLLQYFVENSMRLEKLTMKAFDSEDL